MSTRVKCTGCGWTKRYQSPAKAEFNARRHVCRTADAVRRATRRHRCARCGLATYQNAGATEARYWFGKHSCQKHERLMLRAALGQQRRDLVDRTPMPCLHKQADHQHGTRACYVLDRCRCEPCSKANSEAERDRERQKAYGRYHKYVNAEHVRAHLAELAEYGIGLKRVAALTGVSTGTLSKIVFGVYPNTGTGGGRNGPGIKVREPSRRVLRRTAEAVYAIEAVPANLADGATTPAHGTVLRMRALVALGWSQSKLAERLGIGRSNFRLTGTWSVTARTARAAQQLYDDLSMTLPPETNQRERIAASRARNYAAALGWLPPLALDDDRLDDPGYEPWFEYDPTEGAA